MNKVQQAWQNLTSTTASSRHLERIPPSHWLEMSKSRLYDGDEKAAWTIHRRSRLHERIESCLSIHHYISSTLYGTVTVDVRSFPDLAQKIQICVALTSDIESFNSEAWKTKKTKEFLLMHPFQV